MPINFRIGINRKPALSVKDKLRHSARKLRSSGQWRYFSKSQRERFPLCMSPWHKDKAVFSTCCHHIYPLETHPQMAFEDKNGVPLCDECHDKVSEMIRIKIPTAHLFEGWMEFRND